jgi:hypothetical protein
VVNLHDISTVGSYSGTRVIEHVHARQNVSGDTNRSLRTSITKEDYDYLVERMRVSGVLA